jgi:hypothetical protein
MAYLLIDSSEYDHIALNTALEPILDSIDFEIYWQYYPHYLIEPKDYCKHINMQDVKLFLFKYRSIFSVKCYDKELAKYLYPLMIEKMSLK